jgi:CRP-like cAMP-binding protein/Fe-S-cluster-containing hydrogenase component 2
MAVDYFTQLQSEVEREVMACIGCNDCLLACPLTEKHFVTISQLNYGALADRIDDPAVIDFVQACTQCQQCVPVCPADLHRADIVLWNKMKVEDVAADRVMPLQVGPNIYSSNWTLDTLASHMASLPLFHGVEPRHLRRILLSVTLRRLAPGEVLCREGQYHERLYIVLDGAVEQSTTDASGERARILVMGPGSFHGETAVLGNQEELFTITAVADSIIVEFTKASVHRLMRESGPFNTTMDEIYRRRAVWTQVRQHSLLAAVPEKDVEEVLSHAEFRVVRPGEVIYDEGDPASDLFLVRAGFLRVARLFGEAPAPGQPDNREERVLQYFRDGDVFGGTALLFGQPQTASVSANTRSEIIAIPGQSVVDMLNRFPDRRYELIQQATKSEEVLLAPDLRPPARGQATSHVMSVEGVLEGGVMQGHEVLVIDTSICVDCNNCVDACERRHGYARLDRRGLQLGSLLFPSACRHCEDPVCLLCSVNGIVRLPDGEIRIVPDNCIGCGACASRCPYGNIQMHARDKKSEAHDSGFNLLKMIGLGKKDRGTSAPNLEEHRKDRIAVKCDLCAGYPYYACVHACPVGAAFRIDPVATFGREDLLVGLEMKKT